MSFPFPLFLRPGFGAFRFFCSWIKGRTDWRQWIVLVGVAAGLFAQTAAAQPTRAPTEMQHWRSVFQAVTKENAPKLMVGDIDGYVAAIRKMVKADDWLSQTVAGDAAYRVSPAAAIPFHEAAAKLAPDEGLPRLELGFDYQRTGQCARAVESWQAADRLGALRSPQTAVAAYCFFREGRIDEALALWSRVSWPQHRVSLDFAVSEMALGSHALETHAKAYASAAAGDRKALGKLIANALDWRTDWWNTMVNREALEAARTLAKRTWPNDAPLLRALDCATEAGGAKDAAALSEVLRRYNFMLDDGELPASSEVAKYLLGRMEALRVVPMGDVLRRFGAQLDARAQHRR